MIVHVQPQVDANSVLTYTEMFHTMTDVAGPDFVLISIDWKLHLYSAGEFGMQESDPGPSRAIEKSGDWSYGEVMMLVDMVCSPERISALVLSSPI